MRRVAVALAVIITTLDLLQVVALGKGLGAVGGALVYAIIATDLFRGGRRGAWVGLFMPLIPASVLIGVAGPVVRTRFVDPGMLVVFVVQLVLAAFCVSVLRGPPEIR